MERVTKSFGDISAVSDFSLTVESGEVLGLLGPNGAGKTTAIRVLLGYLKPDTGLATLLGTNPRDLYARAQLGFLPSDPGLPGRMKVGDYLNWTASLRPSRPNHAAALCERLSLDSSRKIKELSRGNKQKVGVVQALMSEPKILVMDEPTSGLDPLVQRSVVDLVRDAAAQGCAVLFSTHVLSEIEQVASSVALMRNGSLVTRTSTLELRAQARQQITIGFNKAISAEEFSKIPGVKGCEQAGNELHLLIEGAVAGVLARAGELDAQTISTKGDDVESLFFGAYPDADAVLIDPESDEQSREVDQ